MLVRTRQLDRSGGEGLPIERPDPKLPNEFCRSAPLQESEMRAVLMVVTLREQTFQMAFLHRNDLIQQISSAASHPMLRYTILPRPFEGRSYSRCSRAPDKSREKCGLPH